MKASWTLVKNILISQLSHWTDLVLSESLRLVYIGHNYIMAHPYPVLTLSDTGFDLVVYT